jgi:hypothetical protein
MGSNIGTSVEAAFSIENQVMDYKRERRYSFFEGVDEARVARMTGRKIADIAEEDICQAGFNEVFLSRLRNTRTTNPIFRGITTFFKYACFYFYNLEFRAQKAAILPHIRRKYEEQ